MFRPQPLKFRVERLEDFVYVEVTGRADEAGLLDMIERLGPATRKHNDQRLLFDNLKLEGQISTTGQMRVGEQIARHLDHIPRIASVVPTQLITRASENTARAHGTRLKVFDSREAAIAWLRRSTTAQARAQMDDVRGAIWEAVRHLFPPHAQALQLQNGNLAISWGIVRQGRTSREIAAPITVRLEPAFEEQMRTAEAGERKRIAALQEGEFRAGLMGYDPFADVPRSRVIVLG